MMKNCGFLTMFLLTAIGVQAGLVDDFENYETGPVDAVTSIWFSNTTDNDCIIGVDPADTSNQVISTNQIGEQTGTYCVLSSDQQIDTGTTKTLFVRFRTSTTGTDQSIGMTDLDTPATGGSDWGGFRPQIAVVNGAIGARQSSGVTWLAYKNTSTTQIAVNANEWYNLWIVINHAAGTYSLYLNQGSIKATEADRLVVVNTAAENFTYRVATTNPLDRIYWRAQNSADGEIIYLDDINISAGADLSFPVNQRPYSPSVEQEAASGTSIPTTLKWKAGADPAGVYEVNPDIVDQYVFRSGGAATDPNLYYIGATGADPGLTDPNSQYAFTGQVDSIYYWKVVEAIDGYEQVFISGDSINLVDPNNIIGPTWSYESTKSAPQITQQPSDARVFTTDPSAAFNVQFTTAVNPVTASWYKDDMELADGVGDVSIDTDPYAYSTLTIATPTLADEGKYYCILSVQPGTDDDIQSATRLLVIKKTLAQFDFEQNLDDTSGNGAPSGIVKTVSPADPNEMLATVVASPSYVDGIQGQAISLDGTQFIDLGTEGYPKAGSLDTLGDARGPGYEKQGFGRGMEQGSILCWVKPASIGAVYVNANGNDNTHFGLTSATANQARMIVRGSNWDNSYQEIGTAAAGLNMTDFSLQDGRWHMFAATWNDSGVRVFINGEQVAVNSAGVPEIYTAWERSNLVGASRSASPGRWILNSLYTGAIDSLRVYNYIVPNDEIAGEYETVSGDTPCADHSFAGSLYNFDNTAPSYCKVDLADFALIARNWLASGLYVEP